jgi:hypothetical protein
VQRAQYHVKARVESRHCKFLLMEPGGSEEMESADREWVEIVQVELRPLCWISLRDYRPRRRCVQIPAHNSSRKPWIYPILKKPLQKVSYRDMITFFSHGVH